MQGPIAAALAFLLLAVPATAPAVPAAEPGGAAARIVAGADPDDPPYEFRDKSGGGSVRARARRSR